MRKAWAWVTILTLGTLYSAIQLAKEMFKLFLEVVCNPGLDSAGTNQWRRAGTEMKEKAEAMRYKVSRMFISLLVLMPKFNAM